MVKLAINGNHPKKNAAYPARGGFTLVELAVVVSIVSVLMTLMLPVASKARQAVHAVQCQSNLRQMGVLLQSYSQDFGYLPPSYIQPDPEQHWTATLTEYAGGQPLEYDPAGRPLGYNLPIFECPSAPLPTGPGTRRNHYSAHKVLMPIRWAASGWTGSKQKIEQIRRPHEVIMLADGAQSNQPNAHGNSGLAAPAFRKTTPNPVVFFDPHDADLNDPIDEPANTNEDNDANHGHIRYRHSGETATQVAFADGHVQTIDHGQILNRNIRTNR